MEIKINKDIRRYTESVFLGLTLRQFAFSLLAAASAAAVYFGTSGSLGSEAVSWLCILAASPFAALGFVNYHGMPAEKLFAAWLRSEVICPRRIGHRGASVYRRLLSQTLEEARKKERKRID